MAVVPLGIAWQSWQRRFTFKIKEQRSPVPHPVYRFAAAVADAYSYEAAGHGFCKEGHVAPALQLVSRQTDTMQLFREGHGLGLGCRFFFPATLGMTEMAQN